MFSCCLNFAMSATARKSSGRSSHAEGPAWLNKRLPNFVRSRGSEKSAVEVEHSLGRVRPAPMGSTMFYRYAGHVPWKTACIMQHSLNWTRQRTGSQCNCNRHGMTCSWVLSLKIKRAAKFCTHCRGAIVACVYFYCTTM